MILSKKLGLEIQEKLISKSPMLVSTLPREINSLIINYLRKDQLLPLLLTSKRIRNFTYENFTSLIEVNFENDHLKTLHFKKITYSISNKMMDCDVDHLIAKAPSRIVEYAYTDYDLEEFIPFHKLVNLKALEHEFVGFPGEKLKFLPKLEKLIINNPTTLEHIPSLKNLKTLSLTLKVEKNSSVDLKLITKLKNLKSLSLILQLYSDPEDQAQILKPLQEDWLLKLEKFEVVIRVWSTCSEERIEKYLDLSTSATHLTVTADCGHSPGIYRKSLSKFKRLEALELAHMDLLEDAFLDLDNLKSLILYRVITANANTIKCLTKLEKLELTSRLITKSPSKLLKKLYLGRNTKFSSEHILTLTKLEKLTCYRLPENWESLKTMPNIQKIKSSRGCEFKRQK